MKLLRYGPVGAEQPGLLDDDPYYFHLLNANKKSVTVNLKSPEGLNLVKDMIGKADVMMENFAPGAIERLGLSYDVVKAINTGTLPPTTSLAKEKPAPRS